MAFRRGSNRKTLIDRVVDDLDPELFDLRPFLAGGVAGLRRHEVCLRAAVELEGGTADDVPALKAAMGVDTAECYRVMLSRSD